MISVEQYRIAYMALPKAACTTVKAALARIDVNVRLPPQDQYHADMWHSIYPTMRYRPHRWQQYSQYWRFCVVRDPIKRLLSCYTDRVVGRKELKNSRKIRRGLVNLPTDPSPDFFFQNMPDYVKAASSIKHHTLPARLFLGNSLTHFDRVYPTDELHQLALDLNARTGREIVMNKENSSEMRLTLDDLQPETIDAVRPYLDQEYDLLKDFYKNPL